MSRLAMNTKGQIVWCNGNCKDHIVHCEHNENPQKMYEKGLSIISDPGFDEFDFIKNRTFIPDELSENDIKEIVEVNPILTKDDVVSAFEMLKNNIYFQKNGRLYYKCPYCRHAIGNKTHTATCHIACCKKIDDFQKFMSEKDPTLLEIFDFCNFNLTKDDLSELSIFLNKKYSELKIMFDSLFNKDFCDFVQTKKKDSKYRFHINESIKRWSNGNVLPEHRRRESFSCSVVYEFSNKTFTKSGTIKSIKLSIFARQLFNFYCKNPIDYLYMINEFISEFESKSKN